LALDGCEWSASRYGCSYPLMANGYAELGLLPPGLRKQSDP
jgi:hypothetical protein